MNEDSNMTENKEEFLKKLAEFKPSFEDVVKAINQFAGGDINWIAEIVTKHHEDMVREIIVKAEEKKASPFITFSVLAAIIQSHAEDVKALAKYAGDRELDQICKLKGITRGEINEVLKGKKVVDYIS